MDALTKSIYCSLKRKQLLFLLVKHMEVSVAETYTQYAIEVCFEMQQKASQLVFRGCYVPLLAAPTQHFYKFAGKNRLPEQVILVLQDCRY
jgi:hypothetical protein